ncbi:hypothetical protein ARMSODRAFT_1016998 [Armillaria solidipes]|uniref:Uncharacterized protein n=1 Tax=Armillaria solidipes TaxID=1076256 RepID=A0A2H3BYF3_9AGAR|nr:hypothetical protein ARMSODRAFT_1016998 [Armillaria solidipes]
MPEYDSTGYSHWADFYQIPIKDNIIINDRFIECLWYILHPKNSSLRYHAAENFSSAAIELIDLVCSPFYWNILVWPFTRPHITRVLCTVDTILDSEQHLGDTCYELIRDISREIDSGSVAGLRNRCKAARLTIERETWRMEFMMYKLRKDFNPMGVREAYQRLAKYSGILCASVFILLIVAAFFVSDVSEEWAIRGFTLAYLLGYLAYEGLGASIPMYSTASALHQVYYAVLQSVWAWRDMRGFLKLIAELEGSQLSDASHAHAKRFLDAFQASFMDGHVELWKTRSKIQTLTKFADELQAMKEQDSHEDSSMARPWYRLNAFQLGRIVLAGLYTKISSLVSRNNGN